jgi:dolichol-phosphate mannosyltransferase
MGMDVNTGQGVSSFSVILPTLNEADNIVPMIETISSLYPSAKILVVDDNSTDGTVERVLARYSGLGAVRVIRRDPDDKGLTASIMEGILNVDTKYFVVMDADFQHPPKSVADMVAKLSEGNELAIGVREDRLSMRFYRQFASWGAHAMARTYLASKRKQGSKDTMSGFFGGDAAVCQRIIQEHGGRFERQGFKALFDILKFAPKDIRIGEVVFTFDARRSGESKLNSRVVLSIMRQCGFLGKTVAAVSTFFVLRSAGRLLAALLLGLVSTLVAIYFTGEITTKVYFNTILAMVSAATFMVLANELIVIIGGKDTFTRGMLIISVAFVGYIMNLYLSYSLNNDFLAVAIIPSMLGLTVAFSFDVIGARLHRPAFAG